MHETPETATLQHSYAMLQQMCRKFSNTDIMKHRASRVETEARADVKVSADRELQHQEPHIATVSSVCGQSSNIFHYAESSNENKRPPSCSVTGPAEHGHVLQLRACCAALPCKCHRPCQRLSSKAADIHMSCCIARPDTVTAEALHYCSQPVDSAAATLPFSLL